jgi:hypothetical protein
VARFVTIGYGDQAGYDRTDPAVREEAHKRDAQLVADGATAGRAGPPVQVRNHDAAGVKVQSGQYMSAGLPIAGFGIIEAETIDEAVELASRMPCAVAQGVVEVWPLLE